MKTEIAACLLKAARLSWAKPLVTFFFKNMDKLLPVDRLQENDSWVAFCHPQPSYPLHILILPKAGIASLTAVSETAPVLYLDLFLLVQALIFKYRLDEHGYRLITNGGLYQSIPQWHWHLISEAPGVIHV